jgi:ATP-binding cassette subfamily D (ALD) long-chain fatty acid import protein
MQVLAPQTRTALQARLKSALDTYLAHRTGVQRALTAGFVVYCLVAAGVNLTGKGAKGLSERHSSKGRKRGKKGRASVTDPAFHSRLKKLLRIVIPGIRSREAGMLALHTCFLLARTGLSLYIAELDGRIVSSLVTAQPRLFLMNLVRFCAIAIPATYTNSMIQYLQNELSLAYRTR